MLDEIKMYLRDDNGNPRGVMMCRVKCGEMRFGFSFCNKKDQFHKRIGTFLARERYSNKTISMPSWVNIDDISFFVMRGFKYFKGHGFSQDIYIGTSTE
jgi:hypothetical protein